MHKLSNPAVLKEYLDDQNSLNSQQRQKFCDPNEQVVKYFLNLIKYLH